MGKDDRLDLVPDGYPALLSELKGHIQQSQVRAATAVNQELVLLYWQIGQSLLLRMEAEGWGAKVIDRLSVDLRVAFPDIRGFSPRNLRYMLSYAREWPDPEILQAVLAKIPWYHNISLLEKLQDRQERLWYAEKAIQHGWSRNVLVHHIETCLHLREGRAQTNFAQTLPAPTSDLAQQLLRDPYNLDFLGLSSEAQERDLERALIAHVRSFLLELGVGFAFVGNQVRLEVGGEEFFIDLLFYHFRLRCFVVIELKTGAFQPEHAGKLSFYLNALDAQWRHPDDGPSIGLVLCRTRNRLVVEYALKTTHSPIGVSEYTLTQALPERLKGSLPTVEELEASLQDGLMGESEE